MVFRKYDGRSMLGKTFGGFIPAVLLAAVFLAAAKSANAADWKGKELAKEGVTHVMNPAQPVEAQVTVSPKLLWTAGGATASISSGTDCSS